MKGKLTFIALAFAGIILYLGILKIKNNRSEGSKSSFSKSIRSILKPQKMNYELSFFNNIDRINNPKLLEPLLNKYPGDSSIKCGDEYLDDLKAVYHSTALCDCFEDNELLQKKCEKNCKELYIGKIKSCMINNLNDDAKESKKRDYSNLEIDE